jgi:predicted XRE-type DNA-binding protein
MTGHKTFRDLARRTMAPEAVARAEARASVMMAELPLQELRRARELSQVQLATVLKMTQPEVSKIEKRTDMYVSTLRSFIEAMGGELDIVARFPDGDVRITQFHALSAAE